jgi:hypothetical protein
MAFPGTSNISYYKGDTYEFRIYPKDSSGAVFDLSLFGNAKFTIATKRGPGANQIEGFAQISDDKTYITCAILPGNSTSMVPTIQYVYDVEITKPGTPYNFVYTLLTGTISVTDQVTGA